MPRTERRIMEHEVLCILPVANVDNGDTEIFVSFLRKVPTLFSHMKPFDCNTGVIDISTSIPNVVCFIMSPLGGRET
jgi:hypothetical protein